MPVCSKIPLLYLLTQKVAQKFGYVLGIRREGCNRPPVLRTASLKGWRGIKALAMFCGLGPPGDNGGIKALAIFCGLGPLGDNGGIKALAIFCGLGPPGDSLLLISR